MPGADAPATTPAAGRRHRAAAICLGSGPHGSLSTFLVVVAQPSLAVTKACTFLARRPYFTRNFEKSRFSTAPSYFEMNFEKSWAMPKRTVQLDLSALSREAVPHRPNSSRSCCQIHCVMARRTPSERSWPGESSASRCIAIATGGPALTAPAVTMGGPPPKAPAIASA